MSVKRYITYHDIRRGRFTTKECDFLGIIQFQVGQLSPYYDYVSPKSFERIMHDFYDYHFISTSMSMHGEKLILFTKEKLLASPYSLKRFVRLNLTSEDLGYFNFWWCLDPGRDWMVFLQSDLEDFKVHINHEHDIWLRENKKPKILKILSTFF